MKPKIFFFIILSISLSKSENNYNSIISFSNSEITSSGKGAEISGTTVTIKNSGSYLITGYSSEGNIILDIDKVNLYLQNLDLTSKINSPILVNNKLENIGIISLGNVTLNDLEEEENSTGECAVIKIKKKSKVIFTNEKDLKLVGKCKNVIKGGAQVNLTFDESNGEYIIDAYKNGISSDNLIEFNGGKFTINTQTGDAIKSSPDDDDSKSLGKILINSGEFNIQSYSDVFQAKNELIIKGGKFNIKTEKGYDSKTFNKDTMSAKGFKVSNNETESIIQIYDGEFDLNTADDGFHSNGNMILIDGNFKIYSGDDAIHTKYHLIIGTQNQTTNPNINILYSYEAIEGASIRIYSGKINTISTDDGINAAGEESSEQGPPGGGPGGGQGGPGGHGRPERPEGSDRPGGHGRPERPEGSDRPGGHGRPERPEWSDGPGGPGRPDGPPPGPPGGRGNANYFISIYGGEINVHSAADGLDSNGNIFIHGGNINIFSQASGAGEGGDNEPIDHDGNFTLFDATIFAAGNRGMEAVHSGILKGNQMYAYYTHKISANNIIKIKNEKNDIIKEVTLPKTVSYTFFTCKELNKNYKFYLDDKSRSETELTFNFGNPNSGLDDQDTKTDDEAKNETKIEIIPPKGRGGNKDEKIDDQNNNEDANSYKTTIIVSLTIVGVIILAGVVSLLIFVYLKKKKQDESNLLDEQGQIISFEKEGNE